MMFVFKKITMDEVEQIAKWSYPYMEIMYMKPYYDNFKKGKELTGPLNCEGFAVFKEEKLFGLFEYYNIEEEVEIGLAISPEFTGRAWSQQYLDAGIDFLIKQYNYQLETIKLSVEKENIPAYKAYLKFGFEVIKDTEEIEMKYNVKGRLASFYI